jgi:hypothetical protein
MMDEMRDASFLPVYTEAKYNDTAQYKMLRINWKGKGLAQVYT